MQTEIDIQPAYTFLGFNLRSIKLSKEQDEKVKEIRISICGDGFNEENAVYSLALKIEIDYTKSLHNEVVYESGFLIHDTNLIDVLKEGKNKKQHLSSFVSTLFPFVRQNLLAITNDTSEPINLPTIDCRMISLENTLLLSKEE